MKAKQIADQLILTYEKGDDLEPGNTITIDLDSNLSVSETRKSINKLLNSYTEEHLEAILSGLLKKTKTGI